MEYNKFTGLKFILPTMHLIIIENNYYIKKLSVTSVMELIDVFNKYSKKQGKDIDASFDKDDLEDILFPDYELDREEKNIIIKDTSRKRWYIKHCYSPLLKVYGEILHDEGFMDEAKRVVDRERTRQRYEIAKEKWVKSSERLRFLQDELEKAIKNCDRIRTRHYQELVDKCKKENESNFLTQVKLGKQSCNHLLVQTTEQGQDIQVEKEPYFYRRRFEYRCLRCGLTNKVYLGGDREFFGPVGEIMWDLTEDLSGFSWYIYNELNNSHIISKPDVAEEIYNELTKYGYRCHKSNSYLIENLRQEVEEKQQGASRVRGAK